MSRNIFVGLGALLGLGALVVKNSQPKQLVKEAPNKPAVTLTSGSKLAGKVALVTGAGGAIGRSIAEVLASHGALVSIADVDEKAGEATAEAIRSRGGTASFCKVDVTSETSIKAWTDSVARSWGGIDVLVNNAAAFVFGTVEETTSEQWDKVLCVNVKGYALTCKHCIPHMRKRGKGSIINIGSISGFVAQPEFVPYNTSKGAINQLSKCIALDHGAECIRVNTVCPGAIDTPATSKHAEKMGVSKAELTDEITKQHFLKRLGDTTDVAHAVAFLASDESGFITGTQIVVDGGYLAH